MILITINIIIKLAITIEDGRASHNIHRATASVCRMTHLLRLFFPVGAAQLWLYFDNRQSIWLETVCDVPRSEAARSQARLPRALAGLGIYSAADIAPCAYICSVVDSAKIRADGSPHSPQAAEIFCSIAPMIADLQLSLEAP